MSSITVTSSPEVTIEKKPGEGARIANVASMPRKVIGNCQDCKFWHQSKHAHRHYGYCWNSWVVNHFAVTYERDIGKSYGPTHKDFGCIRWEELKEVRVE